MNRHYQRAAESAVNLLRRKMVRTPFERCAAHCLTLETPPKRRKTRARLEDHRTSSPNGAAQPSRPKTALCRTRLIFDGVLVPPLRKARRTRESQLMTPAPTGSDYSIVSRASSPGEDYSSWEHGLSIEKLGDINPSMPSKGIHVFGMC